MPKRICKLLFLFLFAIGLYSCGQQPINTAQLQGDWDAVSADVTDPRDGHEILEETRMNMVETDTTMMLSFQENSASLQVNVQQSPDVDTTLQFSGTWEYIDSPEDSIIFRTGNVAWRFAVTPFSPDRMELTYIMPMMSENQIHEVVFEKE